MTRSFYVAPFTRYSISKILSHDLESVEIWVWLRVSNAADKSRAVRIVICPESMVIIREFEQTGLGGMKFAIGRLQGKKLVRKTTS